MKKIFTKGTAPLSCVAISSDTKSLYAGSWDKNIYNISLEDNRPTQRFTGHNDFVKCLLATSLNGKPILLSGGGGTDAAVLIWDASTRKALHKLKGHTKGLQDLAIDPLSLPDDSTEQINSFVLFSASSDREIRRWYISFDSAYELSESIEKPILAHDTSVYKLCFDSDGDLWTASADKTARHLVRSRDWEADTVLQHPDFVRDVVVHERLGVVVTACRDEEVRVWDLSSGDLVCTYTGHFEDVTALAISGSDIVSVSIDGTIRKWSLRKQDIADYKARLKAEDNDIAELPAKPERREGLLSAEEEAELAELMDDD